MRLTTATATLLASSTLACVACLALAFAAGAAGCGKGGSAEASDGGGGAGGSGEAGPSGPTNLDVSWTLAGAPASASTCTAHGAAQIALTLSGTIDPSLHQITMVDCSQGSVSFDKLLVQSLGMPYLEGALLDATGTSVADTGVTVMPVLGTTKVTLAFFGPTGTGGAASTSTAASTSSTAASSTSGGAGGASGASSSASASSTAAASTAASTAAASTSGTSGGSDAGDGG